MNDNRVFVFGSNESGYHGAGAAYYAVKNYGAIYGQGVGRQGNSYAIPTKDWNIKTLPLERIAEYVDEFLDYAEDTFEDFNVTRIGCGLAGYHDMDIAPLFIGAPLNCILPYGWRTINGEEEKDFPEEEVMEAEFQWLVEAEKKPYSKH